MFKGILVLSKSAYMRWLESVGGTEQKREYDPTRNWTECSLSKYFINTQSSFRVLSY